MFSVMPWVYRTTANTQSRAGELCVAVVQSWCHVVSRSCRAVGQSPSQRATRPVMRTCRSARRPTRTRWHRRCTLLDVTMTIETLDPAVLAGVTGAIDWRHARQQGHDYGERAAPYGALVGAGAGAVGGTVL